MTFHVKNFKTYRRSVKGAFRIGHVMNSESDLEKWRIEFKVSSYKSFTRPIRKVLLAEWRADAGIPRYLSTQPK